MLALRRNRYVIQVALMRYFRLFPLAAVLVAHPAAAQFPPSRFVPAVEFPGTTASCSQPTATLQPGEYAFSLRFGDADSAQRVVTAVWKRGGKLVRYSDARGDLRPPFPANAHRNPRTTITIDLVQHVALMYNDVDGEQTGSAASDSEGAMDADNLGPPREMLERLRRQCGAP
jgi:hypothetical protein